MTRREPKPKDFSWISPYLTVRDAAKALAFYEQAFGFIPGNRMTGPDGTIQHAEMKYKDITIMFSPEGSYGSTCRAPATSKVEPPSNLYVYCEDVDAMCARAKQAGAVVRVEPNDAFWGDRFCQVVDPDGYVWVFATNIADFDPAKASQAAAK